MAALKHVADLLDNRFVVPGTSYRFGLDPIIGAVPIIGDLVTSLFTIGMFLHARDLGVPKVVQLRMLFNVVIDTVGGIVPVVGDLFDFAWKANAKNLALLELHANEVRGGSTGDWAFVMLMIALVVLLVTIPIWLLGWLLSAIGAGWV